MGKFKLNKEPSHATHPEVDPAALEAFAAGAKARRGATEAPRPWDQLDPKAPPKYNVSVRLNDYHLEMLRFLSEKLDISQQKIIRKQLIPKIEEMAEKEFESSQLK